MNHMSVLYGPTLRDSKSIGVKDSSLVLMLSFVNALTSCTVTLPEIKSKEIHTMERSSKRKSI
jgi:hypothetical protein